MSQVQLQLAIEVRKEIDGLEMGVLSDGTSFLSMRALSKMCGIANSTLSDTASQWLAGKRDSKLAQWLIKSGFTGESLYEKTSIPGVAGNVIYAFTEDVCTRILEYYAFESPTPTEQATRNYRIIARAGLRLFVYRALGYDPQKSLPQQWRQFHDRLLLHAVPMGHFSVFRETADFVIAAIRGGLPVDHHTIPDISVGMQWSKAWEEATLEAKYGARIKHPHNYPDYFPQAASNPQPMWVYPLAALGEFRQWLQEKYLPQKFPAYLKGKASKGLIPPSTVELLLAEVTPPAALPEGS